MGALQSMARDESGIAAFVESLGSAFDISPAQPIQIQGLPTPLAWLVTGKRSA